MEASTGPTKRRCDRSRTSEGVVCTMPRSIPKYKPGEQGGNDDAGRNSFWELNPEDAPDGVTEDFIGRHEKEAGELSAGERP